MIPPNIIDVNELVKKLGSYGVPHTLLEEVIAIELARLQLLQRTETAFQIIQSLVDLQPS